MLWKWCPVWSVKYLGIYPPAVCQNVAWEELDYYLVRSHLHLTACLLFQEIWATPDGSVGTNMWEAICSSGRIRCCGIMCRHLPQCGSIFCPCPDSKSRTRGKRESFLWRTLNCLLWEALLTISHLSHVPIAFHLFSLLRFTVGPTLHFSTFIWATRVRLWA